MVSFGRFGLAVWLTLVPLDSALARPPPCAAELACRARSVVGYLRNSNWRPDAAYTNSHSIIADSNVLRAIVKIRDGHPQASQPIYHQIIERLSRLTGVAPERLVQAETSHSRLWIGDSVIGEYKTWLDGPVPPLGIHRINPSVHPESEKFRSVLKLLEDVGVGGPDGQLDRLIVTEAFFAKAEGMTYPYFLTADRGVYNKLCLLSRECSAVLRSGRQIHALFPDGFTVTVMDSSGTARRIHVMPVGLN